ncbi:hypothetical protein ACFLYV_01110 [Chloroflexota bacterium]
MADENCEKLKVLIKHWMHHNEEHAAEFKEWAEKATAAGAGNAAGNINRAAEAMANSVAFLAKALESLKEG